MVTLSLTEVSFEVVALHWCRIDRLLDGVLYGYSTLDLCMASTCPKFLAVLGLSYCR